jgi:2Fe-2S ferredoxin
MISVTFITSGGTHLVVEAREGVSLMQVAISNDVPGIDAICGGDCACATCQVQVDHAWFDRILKPSLKERSILRYARDALPNSRLSCAIIVTADLDGLLVRIPRHQY